MKIYGFHKDYKSFPVFPHYLETYCIRRLHSLFFW